MTRKNQPPVRSRFGPKPTPQRPTTLRVIGGDLRGRRLEYDGDLHTRPMKDRVRESVFNLVGPAVEDKLAVDLFAGTGALALEALSRGASEAMFFERRFPVAEVIRRNLDTLGLTARASVVAGDTFVWFARNKLPANRPWLVFCSPPYDFYVERKAEMLQLINKLFHDAPHDSLMIVDADDRFDTSCLPQADRWDVRRYAPAVIGVILKEEPPVDVRNITDMPAFTTKDGSEIRELLAHRNSGIRNQSLAEARLPTAASTIRHFHPRTEEIYYILEGTGRMQIEDAVVDVRPGDAIAILPGQIHQITNNGEGVLKFLCCCAPAYEHEDTVMVE